VRAALAAALLLAAAACGSSEPERAAPKPPRLPHALAEAWAGDADAVAAALAAGDGCAARDRAEALRQSVIASVNAGRVPSRLLEPLTSGVNDLASRLACEPPPPAAPAGPEHGPGKGKKKGHGERHGHGKKDR